MCARACADSSPQTTLGDTHARQWIIFWGWLGLLVTHALDHALVHTHTHKPFAMSSLHAAGSNAARCSKGFTCSPSVARNEKADESRKQQHVTCVPCIGVCICASFRGGCKHESIYTCVCIHNMYLFTHPQMHGFVCHGAMCLLRECQRLVMVPCVWAITRELNPNVHRMCCTVRLSVHHVCDSTTYLYVSDCTHLYVSDACCTWVLWFYSRYVVLYTLYIVLYNITLLLFVYISITRTRVWRSQGPIAGRTKFPQQIPK